MDVKPKDAYFAVRYIDADGNVSFSHDEADLADPNAHIVIWALFDIQSDHGLSPVEGYYDPEMDAFKTISWSRKGEPLYKAAIYTIKQFADKLCDGPEVLVGEFKKLALPLIRKVYPKLIANTLVNVQPMAQPSSLIYYLKHRYSSVQK